MHLLQYRADIVPDVDHIDARKPYGPQKYKFNFSSS